MVTAAASTGIIASSRYAVMSQVQQNRGIFIMVMPGARILSTVTMMLMAPMIEDAPRICTAKMVKSIPGPICRERGAYMVQPAALAPPGTKKEIVNKVAPTGNNQKLRLFMRAKAMSEAPICSGIIQLAKPTNAGMMAPNIIMRPCMVVNWLNSSGRKNCKPGENSSVRTSKASTPPSRSIQNENNKYIVPMSLWFVANTQRRQPDG